MGLPIDEESLNSISAEYKHIENDIDQAILQLRGGSSADVAQILHGVKMREREINRHINRAAKLIDKAYPCEISTEDLAKITALETAENKSLLDFAVFVHLMQQDPEAALAMIEECDTLESDAKETYVNLAYCFDMTDQLKLGSFDPVLEWLENDLFLSDDQKLELNFDIQRANILLTFSKTRDRQLAITQIRETLIQYFDKRESDIAELPTVIAIWDAPKGNSTYGEDLTQRSLSALSKLVREIYYRELQLSPISPLPKAYFAGSECLRAYPKALKLIKSRNATWTTTTQLPMEVPLPPDLCFHPVFVCPISKEETSKDNPPVRLNCGHIFAKSSTDELLKYSPRDAKCPYCPVYIDKPMVIEFR